MNSMGATALALAVLGLLMGLSAVLSRIAGRAHVPVALFFLALGMLAGSDGLGHIAFSDFGLAFRLGTVTLVLILFDGGLSAHLGAARRVLVPAGLLATVGVMLTAGMLALAARLVGFGWAQALLLGAIVSSTDAAAVFSVLRASGLGLSQRVTATLELESGLNDPVAVLLTVALTAVQSGAHVGIASLAAHMAIELVVGLGGGIVVGAAGRWLLRHARPAAAGLLPVLTVALALCAFGVTTLAHGSGFLATYIAGLVIGDGKLPDRSGLLRVHDAIAWLGQVLMFVVLGLLSFPSHLLAVAPLGIALGLFLAFIARPLATAACLLPLRFGLREVGFVGWVGLRGAVPITLAIYPVLAGSPHGERIFDVVFFIVVLNALIPGATVRRAARLLGVEVSSTPAPAARIEIASMLPLRSEVCSFYIRPPSAVANARIAEIELPAEAAIMLVVRGDALVAARGDTVLTPGDHVFVFCHPTDRAAVDLLFGREE